MRLVKDGKVYLDGTLREYEKEKLAFEKLEKIEDIEEEIGVDLLTLFKARNGYAIHITKLEIFDKPKEISKFMIHNIKKQHVFNNFRLTRAPQSWCYVEI